MGNVLVKTRAEVEAEALENKRAGQVVSKFQARAALKAGGRLSEVKTLMEGLPEDDDVRMAWEHAQSFKRMSPTVLTMAQQLNMTDEELDTLFDLAATIEA